jgi:tetratricopeptide (TPR) repeat protein
VAAVEHRHADYPQPGTHRVHHKLPKAASRVFGLLLLHPGPDVSVDAVAALANLPVSDSRGVLAHLANASLVEAVPGAAERWRISRPALPYAQSLSEDRAAVSEREAARDRLLDYYVITTEAADGWLRGRPPVPGSQAFASRDAALTWLNDELASLLAAAQMAADTGRDEVAKSLPLLMAQYLGFRARFGELLAATTVSLTAARRLCDRTAEAAARANRGLALFGLRRYDEAAVAHLDAAAIFREAGDRHGEGNALNHLGLALHGLGRDDEAAVAHLDAAAIFRDTGDRHGEGKALNNLGLALFGLDRHDEAAGVHLDAAAIFQETGDRHGEGNALGNLGNALRELRRSEEAAAAYQEAAEIFRATGDRRSEFMALQSLDLAREAL